MGERKKGKFNVIDLAVILVSVVLIAGAAYKFRGLDKTSKTASL